MRRIPSSRPIPGRAMGSKVLLVAATAERPTIATAGLTKRYGNIVALDDVTVELGDVAIGLLGANGAGKSTLMKTLLGLVQPDAGEALLLGIDAAARGL